MTGIPPEKYLTETQFANLVIELAQWNRWRVVHFRPARTEKGWRTAMTGDQGFPDLVLARNGVVLHVELKTVYGKLGRGQPEWAEAIGDSYRLWRPTDLEQIRQELRYVPTVSGGDAGGTAGNAESPDGRGG